MGDKLFYQRQWSDKAREAAHRAISKAQEIHKREDDARTDSYYGEQLLRENGICPSCLYPRMMCECAPSVRYCSECDMPVEACRCSARQSEVGE